MISAAQILKGQKLAGSFSDVDGTADPRSLVRFLDAVSSWKEMRLAKRRSFELLNVRKGHFVLDIGCGTGNDVHAMAEMVGRTGCVVGVDSSKTMIAEARKRNKGLKLSAEFILGDAHHLGFPDDTFNACRADRTLMHLSDPRQVMSEMIRVTKPGGQVFVTEPDWDTLVIASQNQAIARKLVKLVRNSIRNSGIAHQLPILFNEFGLKDIMTEASVLMMTDFASAETGMRLRSTINHARDTGALSAMQADNWLSSLERMSKAGQFFAACTGFGVRGRKI